MGSNGVTMTANRRVLVTGGAGFIGSHVAAYLQSAGWEVHVADRFSYAGKVRNVSRFIREAKLWAGDLKSEEFCQKLSRFGFDFIVHLAGNTHVDNAIKDPIQFTLDNVLGTNQLLHAFESEHVEQDAVGPHCKPTLQKVVLYSTDEVFGSTPAGQIFDEKAPFNPSNAYSASKVGIEGLAKAYWTTFKMPIIVVRPCNTYGRGQHPEKAIPKFTKQILHGQPMTVHNDGTGSRDWLHTDDHARAIETLLLHGKPGQSYNLAAGDEHTDMEVASSIAYLLGRPIDITFIPGRPGHDRRYWMDPAKIRALGWTPKVPFKDGLRDAVEWTRDNQDWWDHDYIVVQGEKS